MDNRNLSDIITESDCELIENELSGFGKGVRLDKETEQHILSSVMGKAGFKMDNRINHTKKYSRRFIGFMAAAAIAVTGAVGAGAAYMISHKTSIDSIFGKNAGDVLEERDMINGAVYKGEHFDITIDAALSDGDLITAIATIVPNDDYGEEVVKRNDDFEFEVRENPFAQHTTGKGCSQEIIDGNVVLSFNTFLDKSFDSYTLPISANYYDSEDNDYHKITSFDITFDKNLDDREYVSENGEVLSLCDIGFMGRGVTLGDDEKGEMELNDIVFEYSNGKSEQFEDISHTSTRNMVNTNYYAYAGISFSKIIESNTVTAIIINGIRFEYKA